jgi:N4-gp56 family major capsid protein
MKEIFEINLQLFAEPNTQTTTSDGLLSAEMKTFYSKDLIEMLGANLVFLQFGDKVSLPKHGGKTIEWRKWAKFTKALKPLTEGVTPNGTPIQVGTVVAQINQFGDYTTVSDLLELTAIDNVILEVTAKHAENAQVTLDTIVRNELCTGTQKLLADKVVDGTVTTVDVRSGLTKDCKLTPDMVARAAATLKKANAPKIDGSYIAAVHPSVAYDLMRNEEWIDVNKYSNATTIFNGEIGKLYGVRFVESTECPIFSGDMGGAGGIAVYACLFFGKGAYKVVSLDEKNVEVIVKGRGSAGAADPLDQRSTIGWKAAGFGAKIAIEEYIVRVECCSHFSDVDTENGTKIPA